MQETPDHMTVEDQEYPRHLEVIARLDEALSVAQIGDDAAPPNGRPQNLPGTAAPQAEGSVQRALRIADAKRVPQPIFSENALRVLFASHVNKYQLVAGRLQLLSVPGDVRQGFPAKWAAGVSQENQENRLPLG